MTERLKEIFSVLPKSKKFADIGCDHGYIALEMIKSGKAEKVIIADISEKCLNKAKALLSDYIDRELVVAKVSNGFENLDKDLDCALIAGMGGEEIISIIKSANYLPQNLVLQPMKNADSVRVCAVNSGYKILKDYTFKASNKYYDLIVLEKGKDSLTEEEVRFGRTNVKELPLDFVEKIEKEIEKIEKYEKNPSLKIETANTLKERKSELKRYVKDR